MGYRLFSIGSIPVFVSPWYLVLLLWWMHDGVASGLLWAAVVTASLLIHELGHALVARLYRLSPRILLWGLGGLCMHDRARRDRHDALIIAAGPLAGLLLGGLVLVTYWLLPAPLDPMIQQAAMMLLYVNVIWSGVNLLPLWPLDGGQLFRLGLLQILKPPVAERVTHTVSLGLLGLGALAALHYGSLFLGLLVGLGILQNVQALRGEVSSGEVRRVSKEAGELLERAGAAYQAGDFREAARICHQIRDVPNADDQTVRRMWSILGPATARLGEHDTALRYLERAPLTVDVIEAWIECYLQLGQHQELRALLASGAFQKIPESRRREILSIVRAELEPEFEPEPEPEPEPG